MEHVEVQRNGGHIRPDVPSPALGEAWLTALRGTGPPHDAAVGALHELLVGAARSEVVRRWANLGHVDGDAVDELATRAADHALRDLLASLGEYRGASRFTTWACKFAIVEAGAQARVRAWQRRDVVLESDGWKRLDGPAGRAGASSGQADLLAALADGIDAGLTHHQRCVLVALAIDGVPIDVLAERLNTTRGALYATLHGARHRLREVLDDRGVTFDQA